MRITLLRHATLLIEIAGKTIVVDPMLDDAGVRAPVRGTPNPLSNPLVPLPEGALEKALGADAAIVTHTHVDHWDAAAVMQLPKSIPLFCQPEDTADLAGLGFPGIQPLAFGAPIEWEGISIDKTGGQHAHGNRGEDHAHDARDNTHSGFAQPFRYGFCEAEKKTDQCG